MRKASVRDMRAKKLGFILSLVLSSCSGGSGGGGGDAATPRILVTPVSGPTTEAGAQATFTISLATRPSADVTIAVASADATEGTVGVSALTFTPLDFAAPQTVAITGVSDDEADGAVTFDVTLGVATPDEGYAAIVLPPVRVTNVDDDTAGITVSPVGGATSESGGSASFSVVLNSQPAADVTVALASSDLGEGLLSATSLVFTSANWGAPQTVSVTGVNDEVADGAQTFSVSFTNVASSDESYDDFPIPSVTVVNVDDDSAGITVSPLSGATTEMAGVATFSIVLNSEPAADVTVNFDTADSSEGTVSPTSLLFTNQDYATPQTVTVTGTNDEIADGSQLYQIAFAGTASADASYAAITPPPITVTNIDDDSAGILVTPVTGPTDENGGAATFTIQLTSEPIASVTVNFGVTDASEAMANVTSRTFTTSDYATPQSVTVTGLDDSLVDGNQPYFIAFGSTVSADSKYAAITPLNLPAVNIDDDARCDDGDSFALANGTTIPGWTERQGDWTIESERIRHAVFGGVYRNVITKDAATFTDACVSFTTYIGGTDVNAAGGVLRWSESGYIVGLVQDNSSVGEYNAIWIYEYPAEVSLGAVMGLPLGTSPNVEVCVFGTQVTVRVDPARDGFFEHSLTRTTTVSGAGLAGVMTHAQSTTVHPTVDDVCSVP